MPSDCCYFVDKAAAADAAPALYYFGSILHCFAVFTQNLGQTRSIDTTRIYIMTTGMEHRRKIERLGLVL